MDEVTPLPAPDPALARVPPGPPGQPVAGHVGVGAGVGAFFRGWGFLVATPSLWGYALAPVAIAVVVLGAVGSLGVYAGVAAADALVADPASAWATAGLWALRLLFGAVGLLVGFLASLTLAQPLAGFALETLAERQELALGARAVPAQPLATQMLRSLRVTATGLAVSLPVLAALALVTFLVPPAAFVTVPAKFFVAALVAAWDFLDYPFGRRGLGVRARLAWMRDHFAATVAFGATCAALLLVPGVGLLLLPIAATGAARLVASAETPAG